MLYYSLKVFEESLVDEVVLVTGADEISWCREHIVEKYGFSKVKKIIAGGTERYDSVYAGLLAAAPCDYVLIHDGARPLVTEDIISRAIQGALDYQACVAAMPVKDTIKKGDQDGFAAGSLDRSCLWQIQTPQAFSYSLIRTAYDWIMEEEERQTGITDDAMAVESYGGCRVKLVEGSYENLKVTTPEDMVIAEALLQCRGIDPESELL